ncbi:MAG: membrane protein insertase YidC [Hyphomicrobiales bacterium]|nr:membrane protein insertase YidC [Hyphomicrobiales bacterium]
MDENNRNLILAIALSVMILVVWQAMFPPPEPPQQTIQQTAQPQTATDARPGQNGTAPVPSDGNAPAPSTTAPAVPGSQQAVTSRETALAAGPRIRIETPRLNGSISLKGVRIDDIILTDYRETVEENSKPVMLLSPSGSALPFYAEHGWSVAPDAGVKVPTPDTVWTADASATLRPDSPVTVTYDNGEGFVFRRTISVDQNYMFTIEQSVQNNSSKAVTLYPYALISRHGQPQTSGFFILHEGPIGFLGEDGLQEIDYSDLVDGESYSFKAQSGWLGITDKYWAAALIPDQSSSYDANVRSFNRTVRHDFQTDYLSAPVTVQPGASASTLSRLFAGAKVTTIIDDYEENLGIAKFELMIDWGWFHFLTKPMFYALDYFYGLLGNFGVSILIVTVIVKLAFFPLANKSYESMSKMKKLQPEMMKLRERYKDDKMKQQQAMMEMYKKEKVNPMSGCLPILIQIPVFFALYKVLYITIEARHAPFFGWVQDLSAPDPTSIFNLFGLLPFGVPEFLMIGVWPLLMGVSMFVQMKLNPAPTDPIQQKIFTWMPVMFTFLLATFPAGLVIYWTWNNTLSILQQWFIMRRNGVDVNLLENMGFKKGNDATGKSASSTSES